MTAHQRKIQHALQVDFSVCMALIAVAFVSTLLFHLKLYQSSFFYFLLPSFFLILRKTKSLKRIATGLATGLSFGFSMDFIATVNKSWVIPANQLFFQYHFLNLISVDDLFWFASWLLFIIVFYEHFLIHHKSSRFSPYIKFAILLAILLPVVLLVLFFLNRSLITIPFTYAFIVLVNVPIFIFFAIKKPILLHKFLMLSVFFAPIFLLFEMTGLINHQWVFPGQYIGYIYSFGIIIPLEEIIFFILLSTSFVLSYYEFFIDGD